MNSHPNQHLLEMSSKNNPTELFVNICISTNHIHKIIPFFVTHQISFSMSSMWKKNNESTNLTAEQLPLELKPEAKREKLKSDIESLFQKYLIEEIEQTPPNTVRIANELGISETLFKNLFKILYGKTFHQIYMKKRMEHAAKLLLQGLTGIETSRRLGYGEKSGIKFNKMFQKYFGMTPKKYQISHK